jgi:hypothetical protein
MHMDDFDRLLELELARMLDPIVAAPAPRRRRRRGLRVLESLTVELTVAPSEVALVVEPVPVAVVASVGPALS